MALVNYIREFVADYPHTPRDRGPIARCLYAHLTAAHID